MKVVLVGYRGSGKTTVGKRLADRLWQKFVDIDDLIVKKAGKSIRDIFAEHGETHFRDLETEVLRDALALEDHVIALGGGSILRDENRRLIQSAGAKVIYLRCDAEVLLQHIQSDSRSAETRPNLTGLGGGLDEIRMMLAEREPLYRLVKNLELDVSNLTPEEATAYLSRMI
jgi:shikimate kinase